MLFIVQIVVLINLFLFGIYCVKKTKKVNGFAQIIAEAMTFVKQHIGVIW